MELKDMVLSTLAEIDEEELLQAEKEQKKEQKKEDIKVTEPEENAYLFTSEERFLKNLRERILVLFEGLKSHEGKNIEIKVEMILNFLEYLLSTIDERLKESADKR